MACPKGWEALAPLTAPDRATSPLLRGPDGVLRPVDWATALDAFVRGMRGVQDRHGAAAMVTFTRGQGTVFNCGSTEWVYGLRGRDLFVERITRNIFDRLLTGS